MLSNSLYHPYHRMLPMVLDFTEILPLLIKLTHISNSPIFSVPFDGILVKLRGKRSVIDSRNFLTQPMQPTTIPSQLAEMLS